MSIKLTSEERAQAVTSIERYFTEDLDQRIGNIAAGALLGFFLEEVGPRSSIRPCARFKNAYRASTGTRHEYGASMPFGRRVLLAPYV